MQCSWLMLLALIQQTLSDIEIKLVYSLQGAAGYVQAVASFPQSLDMFLTELCQVVSLVSFFLQQLFPFIVLVHL